VDQEDAQSSLKSETAYNKSKGNRKIEWNEFLNFMKQNPRTLLDLVPSPINISQN
jgi:hypothetical protein